MTKIEEFAKNRDKLGLSLKALKHKISLADEEIDKEIKDYVETNRTGKEYGTVVFPVQNVIIKHNVTKKVEYDQLGMKALWEKIQAAGDDPFKYIKVEYKIDEKAFNTFPENVRNAFLPLRKVKAQKRKIEFKILQP